MTPRRECIPQRHHNLNTESQPRILRAIDAFTPLIPAADALRRQFDEEINASLRQIGGSPGGSTKPMEQLREREVKKQCACIGHLLNENANTKIYDTWSRLPLHAAINPWINDNPKILVSLLQRKMPDGHCVPSTVDIDKKDKAGNTALHLSVSGNYSNLVDVLLDNLADVDVKDAKGHTPLDIAQAMGFDGIENMLRDAIAQRQIVRDCIDKAAKGDDELNSEEFVEGAVLRQGAYGKAVSAT